MAMLLGPPWTAGRGFEDCDSLRFTLGYSRGLHGIVEEDLDAHDPWRGSVAQYLTGF
jgi:hypothetical protein